MAAAPGPYRCKVHNEALFDTLVLASQDEQQPRSETPKSGFNSPGRRSARGSSAVQPQTWSDMEEQRRRRYDQHRLQAKRLQAEDRRRTRERVAMQGIRREERFQHSVSSLNEGKKLLDSLGAAADLQDAADRTKSRKQFEEWNKNVFGQIQCKINAQLDSTDSRTLNARKREEYQQFLNTSNTKAAIFRDIIIESEYDPLEPNRHCIKVDGRQLHDPCSRVLEKTREENGMLAGELPSKAPKLRETLDVLHWGTGKIEATPHGFFAKIMKEEGKPKDSQTSKTWNSSIPFDHYDVRTGKTVVDREFPKGKRTTPIYEQQTPRL